MRTKVAYLLMFCAVGAFSHSERARASEPRERSGAQGSPRASVLGVRGHSPRIKQDAPRVWTIQELFQRNVGSPAQQNTAFPPHKIIGNVYYVGTESLASFLVATPAGHILINSD